MQDKFKLIYNQDCTNIFMLTDETFQVGHVNAMVDELAGVGADLMLVNANGQRTYHPSEVWDVAWEEFDEYFVGDKKADYWASIPDDLRRFDLRKNVLTQARQFAESGHDYLTVALARCREKGVTPGVSIRMNDCHDAPWPDSYYHSHFYKDNPRFHLSQHGEESDWCSRALNFEFEEVRENCLKYIQELVDNYSFAWLELDFLRFCYYFPKGRGATFCDTMTGFIERVRAILAEKGDPIQLSTRLAPSPDLAFNLGFDVKTWAERQLIDAVSFGNFLSTAWNMPIEEYRAAVGDDVMLFPSSDVSAYKNRFECAHLPVREELINGFDRQYRDNGADGLELFNFFVVREPVHGESADFSAVSRLSDPSAKRIKIVITTSVDLLCDADVDLPQNTPSPGINSEYPLSFDFLYPEPESATGSMYVHIFLANPSQECSATFKMNNHDTQQLPSGDNQQNNGDIVLEVKADILRRGRNNLAIPSALSAEDIDCIYITNYL